MIADIFNVEVKQNDTWEKTVCNIEDYNLLPDGVVTFKINKSDLRLIEQFKGKEIKLSTLEVNENEEPIGILEYHIKFWTISNDYIRVINFKQNITVIRKSIDEASE